MVRSAPTGPRNSISAARNILYGFLLSSYIPHFYARKQAILNIDMDTNLPTVFSTI